MAKLTYGGSVGVCLQHKFAKKLRGLCLAVHLYAGNIDEVNQNVMVDTTSFDDFVSPAVVLAPRAQPNPPLDDSDNGVTGEEEDDTHPVRESVGGGTSVKTVDEEFVDKIGVLVAAVDDMLQFLECHPGQSSRLDTFVWVVSIVCKILMLFDQSGHSVAEPHRNLGVGATQMDDDMWSNPDNLRAVEAIERATQQNKSAQQIPSFSFGLTQDQPTQGWGGVAPFRGSASGPPPVARVAVLEFSAIPMAQYERDRERKRLAHKRAVLRMESEVAEHRRKIQELELQLAEEKEKMKSAIAELSNLRRVRQASVALNAWQLDVIRGRQKQVVEQCNVPVDSRINSTEMELRLCRQQIEGFNKALRVEVRRLEAAKEKLASVKYHPFLVLIQVKVEAETTMEYFAGRYYHLVAHYLKGSSLGVDFVSMFGIAYMTVVDVY
nr:F-box protein SKIP24 [Ipomoea trifida]